VSGPLLFLAQGDLEERMGSLFEELDFSLWLDPDGASALYSARTVEQPFCCIPWAGQHRRAFQKWSAGYNQGAATTMNDQHVTAIATFFQDGLLFVNAGLIAGYLFETRKLRPAAEEQVAKSQSQASAAYEQVESDAATGGNRAGAARSADQTSTAVSGRN